MAARIAGNDDWLAAGETRANAVLAASVGRYSTTMARVGLALIAVERGDVSSAEEQYSVLAEVPGIMVFYVGTDQVLGQLSATMGLLDQAVGHFEDSLDFCRKPGYRPNLAWTCYDYACALSQRNETGDNEKAVALLGESLEIATQLGMRPLMDLVTENQAALGTQPAATATYPDGLTQREVEVLRLSLPRAEATAKSPKSWSSPRAPPAGTWPTSTRRSALPTAPRLPGTPSGRAYCPWTKPRHLIPENSLPAVLSHFPFL